MTKKVRGYFVILIKQFDDTMFGAEYHYTPWCIGNTKYCRFHRVDRIRKFDFYEDAQNYINEIRPTNSHDRDYEIAYLTYHSADDLQPSNWVQIKNEMDAVYYDRQQSANKRVQPEEDDVPVWDSTNFRSLFKQKAV